MQILLTNDDGIFAPGLLHMRRVLAELGDVTVVAPQVQQSAVAHAITVEAPLRCECVQVNDEFVGYAVDGRPADCVKLAICEVLDVSPDLVISGINAGENVGINVLYSGTVAAAVEAAFYDVPAIAVSLQYGPQMDFPFAVRVARWAVDGILSQRPQPGWLFNVNIPSLSAGWPKGIRPARQSVVAGLDRYDRRQDPRGRDYFWLSGPEELSDEPVDTDATLLAAGYVAVTPLHHDLTDNQMLDRAKGWEWPPPPPTAH